VADTPQWVTLQVVQGGFATGSFAAGGELLPHEREEVARLSTTAEAGRTALNLHFVADAGRSELTKMLRDGMYRVDVPEEGALFVETLGETNGEPSLTYRPGWGARAQALLDDYGNARARHNLCGKPERRKENFFRLRQYLAKNIRDASSMTAGDRAAIRHIVD